jgi:hypothetical protein
MADIVHIVTAKAPICSPGVVAARDYTSVVGANANLAVQDALTMSFLKNRYM